MPTKLTIPVIKSASAEGKEQFLWDTEIRGFGLKVLPPSGAFPSGRKMFVVQYRLPGQRTARRATIGPFGEWTVDQARARARDMLEAARKGADLALEARRVAAEIMEAERARATEEAASTRTFREAFEEYIDRYANKHQKRPDQTLWNIEKYVYPTWELRAIADIKKRDVIGLIDSLSEMSRPATTRRVFDTLKAFFNWRAERMEDDEAFTPFSRVSPPPAPPPRTNTISERDLRIIYDISEITDYPFGPFVQTLILTLQRRNEVARMRWSDLDLSASEPTWHLKASETKSIRAHIVPLSSTVRDLINGQPKLSEYVFTTINETNGTGGRTMSGFSKMKARLDRSISKITSEAQNKPVAPWMIHDLRRTGATGLERLGVSRLVVSKILNHAEQGVTGRHYALHDYLDEKRHALCIWARHVTDPKIVGK